MTDSLDVSTRNTLEKLKANWEQWKFRCNDWEREFVEDCIVRYDRYGERLVMSYKQRNKLSDIRQRIEI